MTPDALADRLALLEARVATQAQQIHRLRARIYRNREDAQEFAALVRAAFMDTQRNFEVLGRHVGLCPRPTGPVEPLPYGGTQ